MLHGTRIASDESASDFARPSQIGVAGEASSDGFVTVPDAHLLFNGDFQRSGPDLKIIGEDGKSFLLPDYFKAEKRPALLSPEGAALTPDVVEALAGPLAPGQYAQAGAQTSDQPAIGRVEQVEGNATIVRNGVAMAANQGDVVRKGDVVQTGDGKIAVLFSDGSTFSLSANARMVLNDFVYQAGGANNSALISLVQGTIGFVAGQVAKTGDMRVDTPVATMGIRGTAVLVEITANNGQTKFAVLVEPDGTTGSFNLYDKSSGALLGTVNNSTIGWVVSPAGPLQVIAQQVQKSPADVQQELNYFQSIFNIFNQGQQNPFVPDQRTDNPNPQNTNGTGTQFTVNQPNNSTNPNNNNSSDPIIVTVTPVNTGNNNSNDGPFNGNSHLPDIFLETGTTNIIHGAGIINGTPIRDIIFGSSGIDIIHADDGPDDVFALGGNDIIIAGHGGGNDFYDGGAGEDTITFTSANGVTFNLNAFANDQVSKAHSASTGTDFFTDIEKVVGSSGNDTFILNGYYDWDIYGGSGVDKVVLNGDLNFVHVDGPEIYSVEIADLNTTDANVVLFDAHGIAEANEDGVVRIIGGDGDAVYLSNNSEFFYDNFEWLGSGYWELVEESVIDPFNDDLTDGITFNQYQYIQYFGDNQSEAIATVYVEDGIEVVLVDEESYYSGITFTLSECVAEGNGAYLPAEAEIGIFTSSNETYDEFSYVLGPGSSNGFDLSGCGTLSTGEQNITAGTYQINVLAADACDETPLLIPMTIWVGDASGNETPEWFLDSYSTIVAFGLNGDDVIVTGNGDDTLIGGQNNDTLSAGGGFNTLIGGAGQDTFVFKGDSDYGFFACDTIADFNHNEGDRIDLSAYADLTGLDDLTLDICGNDTVIYLDDGHTVTVQNTVTFDQNNQNHSTLTESDFIFR